MNPDTLSGAAGTIDQFLLIIGSFNTLSGIVGSKNPAAALSILASGGAFWAAAMGVVEICNGLKQLDGMNPDTLSGAAGTIDQFLLIIGSFNTLSGVVGSINPLASLSMLASGGAFWAASMGVVEICNGLKSLDGMSEIDLQPATNAINEILNVVGAVNTAAGWSLNAFGILASGGAFWEASMGIVEICKGLKNLEGVDEDNLQSASNAIMKITKLIGDINASHSIFDSALVLLAGGGAFQMSAQGLVDICRGLKELQGMEAVDLVGWRTTIDEFVSITKKIESETKPIATTANVLGKDGSLRIAANGIVDILSDLTSLNSLEIISFSSAQSAVDGTVDIIRSINDATSKFGTIFKAIGKDGAFYAATVGVVDVCEVLSKLSGDNFTGVTNAKEAIADLATTLESIGKFLEAPVFSNNGSDLSTVAESVESLAVGLENMAEAIRAWLELTDDLPGLLDSAGRSLEELRNGIEEKADEFPTKVDNWWTKTAEPAINQLVKKFETKWDDSWDSLSKKIVKSWNEWWTEAKKWWKDIPDKISESIGSTKKIGVEIVDGIAEGIDDAMYGYNFNTTLSNIGTYIYNKIVGDLQINSPSKLMRDNVGKGIVEGIGAGLTKYAKLVDKPVIKMGDKTLGYITKYFGIHSPSRLMRDKVGRYIPEGIAAGMDAYAMIAVDSAEDLASSISQTIYSGLGDVPTASYGVSAVIDVEALKTDIELVHEMLRIKIDEIFEAYREFVEEQMQAQFDNESLRYEQILQHMDEVDIELYNQLIEYLNTNMMTSFDEYLNGIINYLESALPDMTQQILSAFEATNQSLSSILQAMSSEQQSTLETAVTQTIVQQLGGIAETLGSSYEGRTGAKWDIVSLLENMTANDQMVELMCMLNDSMKSLNQAMVSSILGSDGVPGRNGSITYWLDHIESDLISGDTEMAAGRLLGNLYYALTGEWKPYTGEKLFDMVGSINSGLFGSKEGSGSMASSGSIWEYLKAIESNTFDGNNDLSAAQLLGYLNTNLFGSATGKAGDLSATVGNIDENQNAFQKALDKIEESTEKTKDYTHQMTEKDKEILAAIEEEYGHIDSIADLKVYLDKDKMVGVLAPDINEFIGEVMGALERSGPIGSSLSSAFNSAFYG